MGENYRDRDYLSIEPTVTVSRATGAFVVWSNRLFAPSPGEALVPVLEKAGRLTVWPGRNQSPARLPGGAFSFSFCLISFDHLPGH